MYLIRMSLLLVAISMTGTACSLSPANVNMGLDAPQEEKPANEKIQTANVRQMAEQTYAALMQRYYISQENLYLEHYEKKPDDKPNSFLWPYSTVISAVNALAQMQEGGSTYRDDLVRVLDGVDKYWQPKGSPPGYAPTLRGGQKFYDDNEWVGLDMVEAYRTLKDPKYLERAEAIFRFAVSGWSEALGGGIYWRELKEGQEPTKNTCSNGPAAVLALKLYEETKNPDYMAWAQKILAWTAKLKSPDNVYWDHMKMDGSINKRIFTYNVGTILHANALLYKATGETKYLEEARALAAGSLAVLAKRDASAGIAWYPQTPWFNAVLLRGYIELYRVDPDKNAKYIDAMRANVLHAWNHAKDANGLFSKDWSGKTGVNEAHKKLLDQAPMVELYALLAPLE